jgi:hypothetical protein
MIGSTLTKAVSAAAALAAGGIFAIASPAQPAVAFFSGGLFLDVVPQSPATLVAKGAAVDVPVEVTCNAEFAQLSVQVTERVGRDIASGSAFLEIACSGGHQRLLVRVVAGPGKVFVKGNALASADIFGCSFVQCGEETGSATITIKR